MTMIKPIKGSCLCGQVTYQIKGHLNIFQYCHCSRCRKVTGSAFAANIIIKPDDFSYLSGEELTGRYELPQTHHFASCFCKNCGSSLPWLAKSKKSVVVPAGTLDEPIDIKPNNRIYCDSLPDWFVETNVMKQFEQKPI